MKGSMDKHVKPTEIMYQHRIITLLQPPKTVFGAGCFEQFVADYLATGHQKLFVVTLAPVAAQLAAEFEKLRAAGIGLAMNQAVAGEPSFADFEKVLEEARSFGADSVAGIGGGSVLDVAKLVAAQLRNSQTTDEVKGIGNLKGRHAYLACIPTTAGTGSEMSPNAIFLNENGDKIGVISPYLVPDAAYVDPRLTITVPPAITAATGLDALAHCLEAYTNKFAHPAVDPFAREGVQLISRFLQQACSDGTNLEARSAVALGSMYGGMCLGPVNTTAAHALAYPLGTDYHLPHGLSVSLLLPAVIDFNTVAAPGRFADMAMAMGVERGSDDAQTAREGARFVRQLMHGCGLPCFLREAGVTKQSIPKMAADAMKVQRLLKNNIREVTEADAAAIFESAY